MLCFNLNGRLIFFDENVCYFYLCMFACYVIINNFLGFL